MFRSDLVALALMVVATPVMASEAYPLHPVHETLARQAQACVDRFGGSRPTDCLAEAAQVQSSASWRLIRDFSAMEKATTWPDDPVREIAPPTIARYGWAISRGCARRIEREGRGLDRAGLMCGSHFGDLQYLHAMRSTADENPDDTRAKMKAWASLTYRVALGDIPAEIPYCGAFAHHAQKIAADFEPANCAASSINGLPLSGWSLGTLFSIRCGNVFTGRWCRVVEPEVSVGHTARGALLHMIQDSFSQSHAQRGPVRLETFESVMECLPARDFYHYNSDSSEAHKAADQPPRLGAACNTEAVIKDAVTASAVAIWMLEHQRPASEFLSYFDESIIGVAAG